MAKVKVEMPEEFLRKLSLLGSKTDEIAEEKQNELRKLIGGV